MNSSTRPENDEPMSQEDLSSASTEPVLSESVSGSQENERTEPERTEVETLQASAPEGEEVSASPFGPVQPSQDEMPFAMIYGKQITEVPKDLYIPPDALEVFLETFEGPLDLLLYLIRRQNLDILAINVSEITDQYVQYVEVMKVVNFELAAEYLVMAALLAEIKSRMLLPRQAATDEEDEHDPRAQLILRLQEYERYKEAAESIDELPRLGRDTFVASAESDMCEREVELPDLHIKELLVAFADVIKRADMFASHQVAREKLSTRERMGQVLDHLQEGGFMPFVNLFRVDEGRLGVVVTFLAVMELIKESLIEIVQQEAYGPIHVKVLQLQKIIEGSLLAAGKPLAIDQLMSLFGLEDVQPTRDQVREALASIEDDCADRGFELKQVASGFRFQIRQELSPWVSRLWEEKPQKYSRALLETLAIIAYRQPMTRGEIEEIRGVSVSSSITKTLLERDWVRIVGHRDVPGKPALYATTKQFLDYFNLKRLDELPTLSEIQDLAALTPELTFGDKSPTDEVDRENDEEQQALTGIQSQSEDESSSDENDTEDFKEGDGSSELLVQDVSDVDADKKIANDDIENND